MKHNPKKIAVIGGGVGAITAVYAITQLPDWQEKYDITLYQLGWRLGGKGASGRNAKHAGRIEEHGLHIWAGFYENGFRLMRDCYETLNREGLRSPEAPLGTLEKAFTGLNHFLMAEEVEDAQGEKSLHPWRIDFYPNDDLPGSGDVLPTPFAYFQMLAEFLVKLVEDGVYEIEQAADHLLPEPFHAGFALQSLPAKDRTPLHLLSAYANSLNDNAFDHRQSQSALLESLVTHTQDWHRALTASALGESDNSRRMGYLISLSLAFFKGSLASGCFRSGFDAIDDWEISEWLLHYGASPASVDSAIFRGCYDYVFGYPGGIIDHRSVGAGTAIRGLLRLAFTYKGALFYKMMAGMGDTIFGPYYQVLKHRGVKFRYFNAATNLVLDQDQTGISAIDMVEQAEVLSDQYDPLVDVQDLPCWPSEPLWDQLKDGATLQATGINFESEKEPPVGRAYRLERGRDFDAVILGASLGSLPYLTKELIDASERWRMMLSKVKTVATQAVQFWVDKSAADMGWEKVVAVHNGADQSDLKTVMTSFTEPLDTWADMSDLIVREGWVDPKPVSIAYFCSPAKNAGADPVPFKEQVMDWANTELIRLWPDAQKDGGFDLSLLHAQGAKTDKEKFDGQYFRQNFYGSERYVMSVPNSVQFRLPPDGSGFENLFLAGDWTRCGINAGCVEAASISGLGAARGLTGADIKIVGEGDLTPDAGPTDAAKLASPFAQTAPWPLTPFFASGQIDGWFSFHALNAKSVQAVLPKGMSLHPQALTKPGLHPVSILANQQVGVRGSILPRFLGYRNYLEAIVAINYVQIEGHEGVFSYLPNLYLNSRAPQLTGVWLYGFNKRMGQLQMGHDHYSVASPKGDPIWSGKYQQKGFAHPLMDSPQAGCVQVLAGQTVVTRGKFSKWQFSSFDFNFGSANVAGVSAEITVVDPALANIPAGQLTARPLARQGASFDPAGALPGAFRIWTSWTLSNPLDSRRLATLEVNRTGLP